MSNSEIQAYQSLEKFQILKQRSDAQVPKEEHWLVSEIKDWCMEMILYIAFIGIILVLIGIFIVLGGGALVFFSILGVALYIYIYKKNKKQIHRKNQQNWLIQAPNTYQYIQQLTDFESVRIPLLIYAIYMVDQMQLKELEEIAMHCADDIRMQNFHIEGMDPEFISTVRAVKNEYSFGLNQVAEVFYILVSCKNLNQNIIIDLIQKMFQSFALQQKDFIEQEDIHLHQLLNDSMKQSAKVN